MADEQSPSRDEIIWDRLVEVYEAFLLATSAFLSEDVDRVALIRKAFYGSKGHRMPAIFFLDYLKVEELEALFDDLVLLGGRSERSSWAIRNIIATMPPEWVRAHIEKAVEPLLPTDDFLQWRLVLELCAGIDRDLTLKLARRASEHSDYDIREAGEDFLEKYGG
ncbi:MAG: hypothetical protein RBS57_21105 [Desulforhabdus sp.]|jgi:hypothetical protein|nr:hypothetical protein [Desulforhabdus sp.]